MSETRKTEQQRQRGLRLSAKANALIGSLLCALGAGAASLIAGGYHWRVCVPLVFTFVLLVVALLFGARAGIVGTLLAAMVFAAFLFQPLGRLSVVDDAARTNLGWMLIIGMSFSFLFAPPDSGLRRR
jgi:K+-sensing histidine kinase KdpD